MTTTIAKFARTALLASLLGAGSAHGFVLTFEGLRDGESVNDFYNDGTGSLGSSGPNYGVAFNSSSLALIDFEAGGFGNFAHEPSRSTVLFFLDEEENAATMNVSVGFTGGFSFYYSSSTEADVIIYDGLNGTGNIIKTVHLLANSDLDCTGDPTGDYCNWDPVGVAFAGTAMSIDFGGTVNQTGYDNVTFGSDKPGNVSEPETLALLGLGLVVLATRCRKWS